MGTSIIGIAPMGNKNADQKAVADSGMTARGEALATNLIEAVKGQANQLKRFLADISALDQQGRKAFRVAVSQHLKLIRAHVVAVKGTPEEAMYATAARSAGVRLSEAVTFSKACDAGYSEALESMPYHACIASARVFLHSESVLHAGPTALRGRKATPLLDKVKAYLEKLDMKPAQWAEVETLVHTMAHLHPATQADIRAREQARVVQIRPDQTAQQVNTAANQAIARAAAAAH